MFKKLEGDTALLRQGGVYKPAELYTFNGGLFAKTAGGYVRLRANGTTSRDGIAVEHMEYEGELYSDRFGRLTVQDGPGYQRLAVIPGETLKLAPPEGQA